MSIAHRFGKIFTLISVPAGRACGPIFMLMTLLGVGFAAPAYAEVQTFAIEFHDGKVSPHRTEVPANRQFKVELHNTGTSPAEFESHKLHKEQVLAPNSLSVLIFQPLKPGEYTYFDDFHPSSGPEPVLEAK